MQKIKGNEQAFPTMNEQESVPGLTIRQHFAGLAMQGLLLNPDYATDEMTRQALAADSVKLADFLIAELNKP